MADSAKKEDEGVKSTPRPKIDDAWDVSVNEWVDTHLRNSAMSSIPSDAWNHLLGSLPGLKKILLSNL